MMAAYYALLSYFLTFIYTGFSLAPSSTRTLLFQGLLYIPIILVLAAQTNSSLFTDKEQKPISIKRYLLLLLSLQLVTVSFSAISKMIFGNEPVVNDFPYKPQNLLAFISIVLVAPVCEEIIFRGYILDKLSRSIKSMPSILISATLFAFLHVSLKYAVAVLGMGIAIGYIYLRTRSLKLVILLHAGCNLIGFALYQIRGAQYIGHTQQEGPIKIFATILISAMFSYLSWIIIRRNTTFGDIEHY